LPDVPTFAEQDLPGIDVNSWWGFVGPAGLPRDVVQRLNAEIGKALADPELAAALAKMAIEPSPSSPEAFGAYLAQEAARWKQVVAKTRP